MPREFVDLKTGEIVSIASYRTPEQMKYYHDKNNGFKGNRRKRAFTFCNMQNSREVINMLTPNELGYYLLLQTYIRYEDNVLITSIKTNRPMNRTDISRVLGIKNRSIAKKHIDKFIAKNLITIEQSEYKSKIINVFTINEKYHFKGKTHNKKVVKSFSKSIRDLFKQNVNANKGKKPENMGFLYLLLPYIHYHNNILCHDPFEYKSEKISPLTMNDISKVTGLNRSSVANKVKNLELNEMKVFAKVKKGNNTHLKINPFIFYRKEGEPDLSLKADFLIK